MAVCSMRVLMGGRLGDSTINNRPGIPYATPQNTWMKLCGGQRQGAEAKHRVGLGAKQDAIRTLSLIREQAYSLLFVRAVRQTRITSILMRATYTRGK